MSLQRDVMISIYHMSHGLTWNTAYNFTIFLPMLGNDLEIALKNFMKIGLELTEKSTKSMRYRFTKIIVS